MVALTVQHPLSPYCQDWLSKIELGKKAKWERFGQYAEEAMRFFDGPDEVHLRSIARAELARAKGQLGSTAAYYYST